MEDKKFKKLSKKFSLASLNQPKADLEPTKNANNRIRLLAIFSGLGLFNAFGGMPLYSVQSRNC